MRRGAAAGMRSAAVGSAASMAAPKMPPVRCTMVELPHLIRVRVGVRVEVRVRVRVWLKVRVCLWVKVRARVRVWVSGQG